MAAIKNIDDFCRHLRHLVDTFWEGLEVRWVDTLEAFLNFPGKCLKNCKNNKTSKNCHQVSTQYNTILSTTTTKLSTNLSKPSTKLSLMISTNYHLSSKHHHPLQYFGGVL